MKKSRVCYLVLSPTAGARSNEHLWLVKERVLCDRFGNVTNDGVTDDEGEDGVEGHVEGGQQLVQHSHKDDRADECGGHVQTGCAYLVGRPGDLAHPRLHVAFGFRLHRKFRPRFL